ncbi:MAG: hypothetical protein JWM85_1623 [Acidimicrobiaceae bacterium]|nr:hypothetical protein [Acidimicrobiaceae bacterium]
MAEDEKPPQGQRAFGISASEGGWRPTVGDTEQRVLGVPLSWLGSQGSVDLRWLRHPIRWTRWRLEVHRRGPYAPRFENFGRAERPSDP